MSSAPHTRHGSRLMDQRDELKRDEGKDGCTGRRYDRCAHPNPVWGRVAPDKVEVQGSAFSLARSRSLRILLGGFSRALLGL